MLNEKHKTTFLLKNMIINPRYISSLTVLSRIVSLQFLAISVQADSVFIEEGRNSIHEIMISEHLPAFSVAVMHKGEMIWSEAFGYSNLEHKVEATTRTKFRIGSISKSLTSVALGLLVESGELDLDVPVQDYVPEFPKKKFPITTRQLASHLSGLPHYNLEDSINRVRYENVIHALDKFKDRPLLFTPGERHSYSSFGWNLIAAIIERAAEEPFLSYMDENVFKRIGMVNTMADHYDQIIPNRTSFYTVKEDMVIHAPSVDNSDVWAGGGFLSTPEDLIKFGNAILNEKLLKKDTVDLLFQSNVTSDGKDVAYGLGWRIFHAKNPKVVGHGGSHYGATAMLLIIPEKSLVIATMTNANSKLSRQLVFDMSAKFISTRANESEQGE